MMLRRVLFTSAMALVFAAPAHAGFTLINPGGSAPMPTGTLPETTIIDSAPIARAPIVSQPLAEPKSTVTVQTMTEPAPAMPMPMHATAATSSKPVRGFGRDIPLIIAAQQITPDNVQVALGDGVDPQQPVSWQGGADWHSVLNDALASRGLVANEQGNLVVIASNGAPVANRNMSNNASSIKTSARDTMRSPRDAASPVIEQVEIKPATTVTTMVNQSGTATTAMNMADTKTVVTSSPMMDNVQNLPPIEQQPMPLARAATDKPATITTVAVTQPSAMNTTVTTLPASMSTTMDMPSTAAPIEKWTAKNGTTLHQILNDWTKRAGVTLRWDTEYDYPSLTAVSIDGDFEGAVRTLLRGFNSAQPQPVAKLFHGHDAPSVLLVTQRGNDIATIKN